MTRDKAGCTACVACGNFSGSFVTEHALGLPRVGTRPDIPGLRVVRIVEKHSLSTGASREAPVDKHARRLNA